MARLEKGKVAIIDARWCGDKGVRGLHRAASPWMLPAAPAEIEITPLRELTMKRARILSLSLPLLLTTFGMAQERDVQQPSPFLRGEERVDVEEGSLVLPWRLLEPAKVESGVRYPLVVFLHGAGERGNDDGRQLTWFAKDLPGSALHAKHPCFVLAPQCPTGRRWVEVDWSASRGSQPAEPSPAMRGVIQAVKRLVRERPIDPDRILLTGLSMGGYGSWDLATRKPTWFAACAPICGGGDEEVAHRLVALPTWAWHGAADRIVPVERSRNMIEALRSAGGRPRYEELEGVGHDSWKPAYDHDGELLPWLLTRVRTGREGLDLLADGEAPVREGETIAFLGDSITQAGAGPRGYVTLVADALREGRSEKGVRIVPAGISGNKVPDLLARLERDVLAKKPTITFVYIGINDVWHFALNGKGTPIEAFESGLRELVERLRQAGSAVVLATPSVIGEKARGENSQDAELDRYAAVTRRIAAEEGLVLCDLRRDFLDRLELLNEKNEGRGVLTTDGVHLNDAGNRFVADRVATALRIALAK